MKKNSEEHEKMVLEALLEHSDLTIKPVISEISSLVRLDPSTVSDITQKLQLQGTLKGFVPVIGENVGYFVVDVDTPKNGKFPDEILRHPSLSAIYIGPEHSYIHQRGSIKQTGDLKSILQKYNLSTLYQNSVLYAKVKSVPHIMERE